MPVHLGELTSDEVRALLSRPPTAALVPVGSVEPHGPHLPLSTDTLLGETAARRACEALAAQGVTAVVAPSVGYGVTDFAEGFPGAVSIPAEVLTPLLRAIVQRLRADGWTHVCLVSNHLEPAHDAAVRAAVTGVAGASVASPLTKRWGRTLSDEFKRAECHAGRYETSLVLAADGRVAAGWQALPKVGVNIATAIRDGGNRFRDIGMDRAYTGAPAEATREEGDALYGKLVAMIVGEVTEGIAAGT
jgi:creatinine amidohydrolase